VTGLPGLQGLIDLLGRRHALTCLWELREAPLPFRTLAQRTAAPDPLLSQRLRELRTSGLLEVDEAGDYRLSAEGRRLQGALEPLAAYAQDWRRLTARQRLPRGSAAKGRGEP
jgi:DNA-binding HxlR family transcriptional regulator